MLRLLLRFLGMLGLLMAPASVRYFLGIFCSPIPIHTSIPRFPEPAPASDGRPIRLLSGDPVGDLAEHGFESGGLGAGSDAVGVSGPAAGRVGFLVTLVLLDGNLYGFDVVLGV